MITYTIEGKDAEQIEGVAGRLFTGPLPGFGDELHIPIVGTLRVLRCEHHLTEQVTGGFAARVIVICEVVT